MRKGKIGQRKTVFLFAYNELYNTNRESINFQILVQKPFLAKFKLIEKVN